MNTTAAHNAPVPTQDCNCDLCQWANRRIARQRQLDADLYANYERYLDGELVSRDEDE